MPGAHNLAAKVSCKNCWLSDGKKKQARMFCCQVYLQQRVKPRRYTLHALADCPDSSPGHSSKPRGPYPTTSAKPPRGLSRSPQAVDRCAMRETSIGFPITLPAAERKHTDMLQTQSALPETLAGRQTAVVHTLLKAGCDPQVHPHPCPTRPARPATVSPFTIVCSMPPADRLQLPCDPPVTAEVGPVTSRRCQTLLANGSDAHPSLLQQALNQPDTPCATM